MIFVVLNALLYIVFLYFYWKKQKSIDNGFLLIGVWAFIAIMGIFLYLDNPNKWKITFGPFIYLFIAFLIYAKIYIFNTSKLTKSIAGFAFKRFTALDVLCIVYIFCAFYRVVTYDFSMPIMSMEEMGDMATDYYLEHLDREEGTKVYSSQIERFVLNYLVWFKITALIGMFNCFCQRRKFWGSLLALSLFLQILINAFTIGSRSALFADIMIVLSGFLLYKKFIPRKTLKNLFILALFGIFIFGAFLVGVTYSRFSDTDMGTGGSLLFYFGQPMLCFDYGIADSVEGYFYGARTFKTTFNWLGLYVPDTRMADIFLGTHFGSNFTTIIGMLILDFGFIGTLVFGVMLSWIVHTLCFSVKTFTIANLYLYLFFLNRLIMGVFTNGSGADMHYIIAFVFYIFFRFVFGIKTSDFKLTKN